MALGLLQYRQIAEDVRVSVCSFLCTATIFYVAVPLPSLNLTPEQVADLSAIHRKNRLRMALTIIRVIGSF